MLIYIKKYNFYSKKEKRKRKKRKYTFRKNTPGQGRSQKLPGVGWGIQK